MQTATVQQNQPKQQNKKPPPAAGVVLPQDVAALLGMGFSTKQIVAGMYLGLWRYWSPHGWWDVVMCILSRQRQKDTNGWVNCRRYYWCSNFRRFPVPLPRFIVFRQTSFMCQDLIAAANAVTASIEMATRRKVNHPWGKTYERLYSKLNVTC